MPKTKPRLVLWALSGEREYLVIYDAEDIRMLTNLEGLSWISECRDIKCLQAKLNYFNPHHNLLTRLFTAEYSLWFDLVLTGLQLILSYRLADQQSF